MKLYLIKLFFYWKEKDRCIESTNLSVLAFVHVIFSMVPIVTKSWRLRWESALPNSDETNNHNKSQLKSTQTICEGWYITGGNFERSKSSLVLVTCACTSIKSASRFCEDKPWSRGKPPQKWIFQNVDYGYVQTKPDEFSIGGKFMRLGVSFSWNHAKCTKIWTPKRSKIWTPKSRTNL